uniref:Uncharacterized protein n=1 Tax=Physcomitrium patens TaxID=3218 RepID=A0A2K1IDT7_PHYPA|nr:hypothetical protein PHYPA_029585 [Physcomitrium patens]
MEYSSWILESHMSMSSFKLQFGDGLVDGRHGLVQAFIVEFVYSRRRFHDSLIFENFTNLQTLFHETGNELCTSASLNSYRHVTKTWTRFYDNVGKTFYINFVHFVMIRRD